MIHHTKAVARGARYALIIGDMPFMSYNMSEREAIFNAGRFMKEGGADAVKLEGGATVKDTVRAHRQGRDSRDGPYRTDSPDHFNARRV